MKRLKEFITDLIKEVIMVELSTDYNLVFENDEQPTRTINLYNKPSVGDSILLKGDDRKYFLVEAVEYSETGYTGNLYGKIVE